MGDFELETRVDGGGGRYRAELSRNWEIARFAPVEVEVGVLRRARRAEAFRVGIQQEDRRIFEGLVRTAAEGPGLTHESQSRLEAPDPATLACGGAQLLCVLLAEG